MVSISLSLMGLFSFSVVMFWENNMMSFREIFGLLASMCACAVFQYAL